MIAKDLLYKILEYNYLWALPYHKDSKPVLARLAQIDVLLDSFDVSKKQINPLKKEAYTRQIEGKEIKRSDYLKTITNIDYFMKGEFLIDRDYKLNKELTEVALNKVKTIYTDLPDEFITKNGLIRGQVDIGWMVNNLFNFRQDIHKFTDSSVGMMEGFSVGLIYSKVLQKQLTTVIRAC